MFSTQSIIFSSFSLSILKHSVAPPEKLITRGACALCCFDAVFSKSYVFASLSCRRSFGWSGDLGLREAGFSPSTLKYLACVLKFISGTLVSALKRYQRILFYPFSLSVHTNTIENGGFRKRSLEWRFLKTEVQRLCVDGRKRRFSKTITPLALACPS